MRNLFPTKLFMSVTGFDKGEENIRYYKRPELLGNSKPLNEIHRKALHTSRACLNIIPVAALCSVSVMHTLS